MKISSIGGEFELIKRITKQNKNKNRSILVGIGDDAAVIKFGNKKLAITTDSLVENIHFSAKYFSPEQIGMKAIEVNVSDIAAIAGIPKYALISLVLRESTSVEFIEGVYKGIYKTAEKYGIEIIGGNTAHGSQVIIDITILGEVKKPITRAGAKPGDLIFVTGELGKSSAGFHLLKQNISMFEELKKSHLEPKAQLEKSKLFAPFANSMIDISDGLGSDLWHICKQSNVGAVISKEKIPLTLKTKKASQIIGKNPFDLALYGGEDYHLLFTVSRKNASKIRGAYHVGEITREKTIFLKSNGKRELIKRKGYNHFPE